MHLIAHALSELRPAQPVIVPDVPGFGETPALPGREHDLRAYGEWLQAFAQGATQRFTTGGEVVESSSSTGTFDVLGHSFGSLIVAQALSLGLAPRRVILINPISSPALRGPNALMTRLAIGYYRTADTLPHQPARTLLSNGLIVRLMSEVMAKTWDLKLRRWIHDQHARHFSTFSDTTTLLEAFRASVSHTVTDMSSAFTMPTLIIAGDQDDIAPLAGQVALRHHIPASVLRIIPGVGHLVHYEAADDAAGYTARFLGQSTPTIAERSTCEDSAS